jgi:hypothetical protein
MKAIRLMERAAGLRGENSQPETCHAVERLIVKYNTVAVRSFKQDDYETATALLTNAHNLTEPTRPYFDSSPDLRLRLRGTTYNNLGCMERRRSRLDLAVKYLRLSLEHDGNQSAVTYLNLGAIYTQMRRPEESVACSRRAIALLNAVGGTSSQNPGLLAIAHHNLAMALETLDRDACLSSYETALSVAKSQLGPASPTTVSIQRNYERFTNKFGQHQRASPGSPPRQVPPSQTFLPPITSQAVAAAGRGKRPHASTPRSETTSPRVATSRRAETVKKEQPQAPARTNTAPQTARPAPPKAERVAPRRAKHDKPKPAFETESDANSIDGGSDRGTTPPPALRLSSKSPPKTASALHVAPRPPATSRAVDDAQARPGRQLRHLDADEERRKDDVVAWMMSRLGALLKNEDEFETKYAAAVKIQCLVRGIAAREAAERRRTARQQAIAFQDLRERKAAQAIVGFFRMLVDRRKATLEAEADAATAEIKRDAAAVKIQATARRWLARQLVKRLRVYYRDYTRALRTLQCWFRLELSKNRIHKMKLVDRDATGRKLEQERRHFAATQIQRSFRAFLALKATATRKSTLRAARERDRDSNRTHAIKRLQAFFRRVLATMHTKHWLADRHQVVLQRERAELRLCAAVTIQAFTRGWQDRKRTVHVTNAVRAVRAREAQRRKLAAAIRLQCFARRIKATSTIKDLRNLRRVRRVMNRQAFAAPIIKAFVQGRPAVLAYAAKVAPLQPSVHETEDAEAHAAAPLPVEDAVERPATPSGEVVIYAVTESAHHNQADDVEEPDTFEEQVTQAPRDHLTDGMAQESAAPEGAPEETDISDKQRAEPSAVSTEAAHTAEPKHTPASAEVTHTDVSNRPISPLSEEEPYVMPPRVPTPPHLKLSVAYLEEKRKHELAKRQQKRLAELDPTLRPAHEIEEELYQTQRQRQRLAETAQAECRRNLAAVKLQSFFRGVFDRSMFQQKRAILAEYIDELDVRHRHAPQRPQPKPPVASTAARSARRDSHFAVLDEVSSRIGGKIDHHRRVVVVTAIQSALRCIVSQHVLVRRQQHAPVVARAGRTLTRFGRYIASRSSSRERKQKVHRQCEHRVAEEGTAHTRVVRATSVVAAFVALQIASREMQQRLRVKCEMVNRAQRTLRGFNQIIAAKQTARHKRAALSTARAARIAAEDAEALITVLAHTEEEHDSTTPEASIRTRPPGISSCVDPRGAAQGSAAASMTAYPHGAPEEASVDEDSLRPRQGEVPMPTNDEHVAAPAETRQVDGVSTTDERIEEIAAPSDKISAEPVTAARSDEERSVERPQPADHDKNSSLPANRDTAAVKIQCVARQRQARRNAAQRRERKAREWELRRQQFASEDDTQFRTPPKGDGSASSDREQSPAETVQTGNATTSALPTISATSRDAEAAAAVIQRGFRVHNAKQEASRRRVVVQAQWEERRRRLEDEEADETRFE